MQWMADGIHDFTVTDRHKNPSNDLIVSWIAGALSDISKEIIESFFFQVYPKHKNYVIRGHSFPYH